MRSSFFGDNRVLEKLLVYQNVAVLLVAFSSPYYQATQTHSSHGALTISFRRAPYPHGHLRQSWIRWMHGLDCNWDVSSLSSWVNLVDIRIGSILRAHRDSPLTVLMGWIVCTTRKMNPKMNPKKSIVGLFGPNKRNLDPYVWFIGSCLPTYPFYFILFYFSCCRKRICRSM